MHEAAATCSWRRTHSHGSHPLHPGPAPRSATAPAATSALPLGNLPVMCLCAALTPAKPLVTLSAQRTLWGSAAAVPITGVTARAGLSWPPGTREPSRPVVTAQEDTGCDSWKKGRTFPAVMDGHSAVGFGLLRSGAAGSQAAVNVTDLNIHKAGDRPETTVYATDRGNTGNRKDWATEQARHLGGGLAGEGNLPAPRALPVQSPLCPHVF